MGAAFTPEEAKRRKELFGRGEIRVLNFTYDHANPLSLTGAAFSSFTADKDYVIRKVFMSAIGYGITTPGKGLVSIGFQDLNGVSSFPSQAYQVGGVVASMAFRLENSCSFAFGESDEKENVPLEKNRVLYAMLRNDSADGSSMCQVTVHLLPVGSQ